MPHFSFFQIPWFPLLCCCWMFWFTVCVPSQVLYDCPETWNNPDELQKVADQITSRKKADLLEVLEDGSMRMRYCTHKDVKKACAKQLLLCLTTAKMIKFGHVFWLACRHVQNAHKCVHVRVYLRICLLSCMHTCTRRLYPIGHTVKVHTCSLHMPPCNNQPKLGAFLHCP